MIYLNIITYIFLLYRNCAGTCVNSSRVGLCLIDGSNILPEIDPGWFLLWQMVHEHLRVAIEPNQITNKA